MIMDRDYEIKHHALEETTLWFRARRDMIARLIHDLPKNVRILDVGCAGGSLLKSLGELGFANSYGIDLSENAVKACHARGLGNVFRRPGALTGFPDSHFDLVIASDVLEHITDERAALQEWNRILRPGGCIIVFVPAFGFLWSGHDEAVHHQRRYSKMALWQAARNAGFEVSRLSYWNVSLFFPTAAFRLLFKGRKGDQLYRLPSLLNELLAVMVRLENWILLHCDSPVGVSLFMVAKKP